MTITQKFPKTTLSKNMINLKDNKSYDTILNKLKINKDYNNLITIYDTVFSYTHYTKLNDTTDNKHKFLETDLYINTEHDNEIKLSLRFRSVNRLTWDKERRGENIETKDRYSLYNYMLDMSFNKTDYTTNNINTFITYPKLVDYSPKTPEYNQNNSLNIIKEYLEDTYDIDTIGKWFNTFMRKIKINNIINK